MYFTSAFYSCKHQLLAMWALFEFLTTPVESAGGLDPTGLTISNSAYSCRSAAPKQPGNSILVYFFYWVGEGRDVSVFLCSVNSSREIS